MVLYNSEAGKEEIDGACLATCATIAVSHFCRLGGDRMNMTGSSLDWIHAGGGTLSRTFYCIAF